MAEIPLKTEPEPGEELENDSDFNNERDAIHIPAFDEKLELLEIVKKEEPIEQQELSNSDEHPVTEVDPLVINEACIANLDGAPDKLNEFNACGENDGKRISEQKVLAWTIYSNDSEPSTSQADGNIDLSVSPLKGKRKRRPPEDKDSDHGDSKSGFNLSRPCLGIDDMDELPSQAPVRKQLRKKKKKNTSMVDGVPYLLAQKLAASRQGDTFDDFGKMASNKLRKLPDNTRIHAERLIKRVLLEGLKGNLNRNTRIVNAVTISSDVILTAPLSFNKFEQIHLLKKSCLRG